ncbi:hypothetical protein [Streptomyces longispororuber]|uniref:hypothetical protein n=1 Tax=Streptomyces longispororuber TaxID=68230 RepID=UPI00210B1048|nr:hypothetical protein [Streptomyces longispororuber]MCQ4209571.1 hypothetical protein [Streptomyces longispororuber]
MTLTGRPAAVGVTWRELIRHWAGTVPVRMLGAGLVVLAYRPWEGVRGVFDVTLFGGVVAFALWAAPGVDRRPAVASSRWSHRLALHRTTVLAAGSVALAALGDPPQWQAGCLAVLLVGYLTASDAWSLGPTATRSRRRTWLEALAACAGAGVVLLAAAPDVPESGFGRPLAALVLAAAATGATLAARRSLAP